MKASGDGNGSGSGNGAGKATGKLQALVFDFDGTLAELHLNFAEMKRRVSVLAEGYLQTVPSQLSVRALEWIEVLAEAVEKAKESTGGEFRERSRKIIVEMELEAARRGALFPFTRPILADLHRKGIKIAIITRNCERAVRIVFPDVEDYCSSFLTRDHVPRIKPDPDHLLRALKALGIPPDKALMVGDHPLDVRTGKGAGALTAGVWSGSASRTDLVGSGADWTAPDCETLIRELQERDLI